MKSTTFFLFPFLLGVSFVSHASSWQIGADNDALFKNDGDYTNGLFLGYSSDSRPLPEDYFIPLSQNENYQVSWSTLLGQKMWTPSRIRAETPEPNERPYAGLLYLDTAVIAHNSEKAHRLGVMLGVTGPASGAEWLQRESHKLMGHSTPMGWDYQIKNTPAIDVSYEYDHLFFRSEGRWQNEFSGHGRAVAGNFQPEVALGLGWRYGPKLASSFNATTLRPHRQQVMLTDGIENSGFFYASFEAFHRFDDLTITGNTLKPVPEMDVQNDQVTLSLGVVYFMTRMGVGFSVTNYSRNFKQDKNDSHFRNSLTFYWKL